MRSRGFVQRHGAPAKWRRDRGFGMHAATALVLASSLTIFAGNALAQTATDAQATNTPATNAQAAVEAPEPAKPEFEEVAPKFTISIEPSVWLVGAGGTVKMPGSSSPPPVAFGNAPQAAELGDRIKLDHIGFDDPQAAPAGEVNIGYGRWRFALRGFGFSIDDDSTVDDSGSLGEVDFAPGDSLVGEINTNIFEAQAGYRFFEYVGRPRQNGDGYVVRFYADALGGARYYDVDMQFEQFDTLNGSNSFDDAWIEPTIGGKIGVELYEQFDIDLEVNFGAGPFGDHASWSWDVIAGFQWRPVENVGVQIGYRNLAFDLQDGSDADEFEWDGALAGLYFGAVIKF